MCALGARESEAREVYCKKDCGRLPACMLCASGENAFAFERLLCAAFPVGTVINEDLNGETQRRRFP